MEKQKEPISFKDSTSLQEIEVKLVIKHANKILRIIRACFISIHACSNGLMQFQDFIGSYNKVTNEYPIHNFTDGKRNIDSDIVKNWEALLVGTLLEFEILTKEQKVTCLQLCIVQLNEIALTLVDTSSNENVKNHDYYIDFCFDCCYEYLKAQLQAIITDYKGEIPFPVNNWRPETYTPFPYIYMRAGKPEPRKENKIQVSGNPKEVAACVWELYGGNIPNRETVAEILFHTFIFQKTPTPKYRTLTSYFAEFGGETGDHKRSLPTDTQRKNEIINQVSLFFKVEN